VGTKSERRKTPRVELAVPVRVQGFNPDGTTWEEFSATDDISIGGASFPVNRSIELGQVLYLALPLPKRLRQFDLNDASYRVYGLIRGIKHGPGQSRIGVMFFGKFPPRGFHEKPWARFLLPSDSQMNTRSPNPWPGSDEPTGAAPEAPRPRIHAEPSSLPPIPLPPPTPAPISPPEVQPPVTPPPAATPPPRTSPPITTGSHARIGSVPPPTDPNERRRSSRVEIFVNFTIQQVDEWGAVLQEELTVADNLSKGGARVMTSLDFMKGDVVQLQEAGGGFATRAEIREVRKGADGIVRLHLRFLDRQTPDRLMREG
jgi:hypothetical protein